MKQASPRPAALKPLGALWHRRVSTILEYRNNANRLAESSATESSRPNSRQDQTTEINKDLSYSRPLSTITSTPTTPDVTSQSQHNKHQSVIEVSARPTIEKRKSLKQRFSMFSRKSMIVAAH